MNGIVNLYKEKGMTSFRAVDRLRRILGVKKCGHLGTLDPLAEGVLPVCVGNATKFVDYLMDVDKEYIAEFTLGMKTDSFDTEGTVLGENDSIRPSITEAEKIFKSYIGEHELTVPAFSSKKINGERAYKLARRGEIEDAGKRRMRILSVELIEYAYPKGVLKVQCGKGTYIRSIIHEAGLKMGCFGVMSGLIRSANGEFRVAHAFTLGALEEMAAKGTLTAAVHPVYAMLDWKHAILKDEAVKLVSNGVSVKEWNYACLPFEGSSDGDMFFITEKNGRVLAIAEKTRGGDCPLKIIKVLI
ncbi:tRNA pseudouridine(55) synthase TruB [Geovibrio thiophilus]|uniref:tRNA pseudouridine synthase B n=1 Tax=Geovibrio thiophilus TaxID=139438 RepID=A0A3R5UXP5_9BACT|nr:tRNA pseudouridine(55) synthase TruB [Geovibrio thiophilus]QAR33084.1 tRNA pseudouridine(55) synthase TruB [Geovibrio thiophilus]